MRSFIIIILSFIILTAFSYEASFNSNEPKLKCVLTSFKNVYRIGESPRLIVQIINNYDKNIYLIKPLDGSERKKRMPYSYFEIEKPIPDTVISYGCGSVDPLQIKNFRLVEKGESFYPYEMGYGYLREIYANYKEFRNPGVYKIRFHYSTKSDDISNFQGSMSWDKFKDSTELKALFAQVPKVDIVSNEIEIKFEE